MHELAAAREAEHRNRADRQAEVEADAGHASRQAVDDDRGAVRVPPGHDPDVGRGSAGAVGEEHDVAGRGLADGEERVDDLLEALAALQDEIPDLVICDYKMPGMNGREFLDRMCSDFPAVPVVVVTGMADELLAKDLVANGASACLFKPLPTLRLLLEAVEKAIGDKVQQ